MTTNGWTTSDLYNYFKNEKYSSTDSLDHNTQLSLIFFYLYGTIFISLLLIICCGSFHGKLNRFMCHRKYCCRREDNYHTSYIILCSLFFCELAYDLLFTISLNIQYKKSIAFFIALSFIILTAIINMVKYSITHTNKYHIIFTVHLRTYFMGVENKESKN